MLEGIGEDTINPEDGILEGSTETEASDLPDQLDSSVDTASDEEVPDEEVDFETLQGRYKDAVKGIHEKGQEATQLQKESQLLQQQIEQLKAGLQDPNTLQTLLDHANRVNGAPAIKSQPTAEELESLTGLDEPMQKAFDTYLEARGYVRGDDPLLQKYQGLIDGFASDKATSSWQVLADKYPDAERHKQQVVKMLQVANDAGVGMTLEQAYHGVTNGASAAKAAETKLRGTTQQKVQAQLPRSGARGVTSKKAKDYSSFEEAFNDAMRESGMTSFNPRMRT